MDPYRPMINSQIVVRLRDGGTIQGVLHSVTRKTAWMLVPHVGESLDEFVNLADIAGINLVCATERTRTCGSATNHEPAT